MKTNKNKIFDAVKFMRQERDRISKEIADMNHEQIIEYFSQKRTKDRIPQQESAIFYK
ncbi:MAG: hypothetical protein RO257_10450 [Candidatus Kapabacteria bacterium]|jgi:hypothetical protein|nr:hypothetical protein [Candidatus Kapabacteria bacterium]